MSIDGQGPYDNPDSPEYEPNEAAHSADDYITPTMIDHLEGTKPWVRFISFLLFIACGLIAVIGIVMFVWLKETEFASLLGVIYILLGAIYFFPALYLSRYASAIGDVSVTRGSASIENALGHQRSFWKFIGILAAVVLCLWVVGIVAAIAVPPFVDSREKAYTAAVKSDLRNLVTAEESFFADNGRYGSVSELMDADYWISTIGVTVEESALTSRGFAFTGTHTDAHVVCGVFVGAVEPPHRSLTLEGRVECW